MQTLQFSPIPICERFYHPERIFPIHPHRNFPKTVQMSTFHCRAKFFTWINFINWCCLSSGMKQKVISFGNCVIKIISVYKRSSLCYDVMNSASIFFKFPPTETLNDNHYLCIIVVIYIWLRLWEQFVDGHSLGALCWCFRKSIFLPKHNDP